MKDICLIPWVQENSESFKEFLTKIQNKSKLCDFGQLTDSLMKDRIIVGISNNNTLREKLLSEDKLTLEKKT